jgi:hypothetical protein
MQFLLGMFIKLQEAIVVIIIIIIVIVIIVIIIIIISFTISVCLSVCQSVRLPLHLHETTRLPLDRFSWNLIFKDFAKFCQENSRFIKI